MYSKTDVIRELKKAYPNAKYYLNFSNPLELMVAAILSAQVKDEVVNAVTKDLFSKYKTAGDYANCNISELEDMVKKVTFYRNKAKNIKEACRIIVSKHNGNVPRKMNEMLELPGIARKTGVK